MEMNTGCLDIANGSSAVVPKVAQVHHPLNDVIAGWHGHGHGHGHGHTRTHGYPHALPGAKGQMAMDHRIKHEKETTPLECVVTTIRRIDAFLGGFSPASVSLLASQSEFLFNLVARVIVSTISTTERDVIYVDGGNSLDPYLLTAACRLFRLDADSVLRRVQVARAFTVFQLDTLITQNLERILAQHKPKLVLVSCLSELFLDRDVNWFEAKTLFETDFLKLKKLTERYEVTTLVTNFGRERSIHRFELDRKLRKWLPPERRVSIKVPSRNKLRLVKGNGEFMDYFPLPAYQWTLDDFCPRGDICG
jgi:hypothetical protein